MHVNVDKQFTNVRIKSLLGPYFTLNLLFVEVMEFKCQLFLGMSECPGYSRAVLLGWMMLRRPTNGRTVRASERRTLSLSVASEKSVKVG